MTFPSELDSGIAGDILADRRLRSSVSYGANEAKAETNEYSGGFLRCIGDYARPLLAAAGFVYLAACSEGKPNFRNELVAPSAVAVPGNSEASTNKGYVPQKQNQAVPASKNLPTLLSADRFVFPGPPQIPPQFNQPAYGVIERVDCEFDFMIGYALDPDNINMPIWVHRYKNGPAGSPEAELVDAFIADTPRKDVGAHGFREPIPKAFKTGKAYTLAGHAIDIQGWPNQQLYDRKVYVSFNGIKMHGETLVCLPEE